jgi:hypothetical protein
LNEQITKSQRATVQPNDLAQKLACSYPEKLFISFLMSEFSQLLLHSKEKVFLTNDFQLAASGGERKFLSFRQLKLLRLCSNENMSNGKVSPSRLISITLKSPAGKFGWDCRIKNLNASKL